MELKGQIYALEKRLSEPETRRSPKEISALLADSFVEFCSSGKEYRYQQGDVFDGDGNASSLEIRDFEITLLAYGCVLATYRAVRNDGQESLRSSIWQQTGNGWKMVFHQGTPAKE